MAIEVTEFVPTLEVFPWSDTGAPDPSRQGIRPMGNLRATMVGGVIPVPGAGDFQAFRATITLPDNFMYALQDVYCAIGGAGADPASDSNWELIANMDYLDATAGNTNTECRLPLISPGAAMHAMSGASWQQAYCLDCPVPKFLQKAGSVFSLRFVDRTVDDIAADFDLTMSFLVFTIAQEFDAGVNTPILIR